VPHPHARWPSRGRWTALRSSLGRGVGHALVALGAVRPSVAALTVWISPLLMQSFPSRRLCPVRRISNTCSHGLTRRGPSTRPLGVQSISAPPPPAGDRVPARPAVRGAGRCPPRWVRPAQRAGAEPAGPEPAAGCQISGVHPVPYLSAWARIGRGCPLTAVEHRTQSDPARTAPDLLPQVEGRSRW
jgi:hypothetical protein